MPMDNIDPTAALKEAALQEGLTEEGLATETSAQESMTQPAQIGETMIDDGSAPLNVEEEPMSKAAAEPDPATVAADEEKTFIEALMKERAGGEPTESPSDEPKYVYDGPLSKYETVDDLKRGHTELGRVFKEREAENAVLRERLQAMETAAEQARLAQQTTTTVPVQGGEPDTFEALHQRMATPIYQVRYDQLRKQVDDLGDPQYSEQQCREMASEHAWQTTQAYAQQEFARSQELTQLRQAVGELTAERQWGEMRSHGQQNIADFNDLLPTIEAIRSGSISQNDPMMAIADMARGMKMRTDGGIKGIADKAYQEGASATYRAFVANGSAAAKLQGVSGRTTAPSGTGDSEIDNMLQSVGVTDPEERRKRAEQIKSGGPIILG